MTVPRDTGAVPVLPYVFSGPESDALTYFARNDDLQDKAGGSALWTEEAQGYWVFTDHEVILNGLQQPDLFSNKVLVPVDPDPPYMWIPIMLDPPLHTKWRQLLGSYFSPKRVADMKDQQRRFAVDLIDRFKATGSCEYMADFGQVFPTTIFLEIMGMPTYELDEFMVWEHQILHTNADTDPDGSVRFGGMQAVMGYFAELIAERRAAPDPDARDIVSTAVLTWAIDGVPVSDDDLLSCFLLLFMAGLDTVAAQSGYIINHLAGNPELRARLVADPGLMPQAIEEFLRVYPIVQTARKVTRDADFHGTPIKEGDMATFPLSMAGRDDSAFAHSKSFDLDRENVRHFSFGAGPHRCLGSHLARQELVVILEEWHKALPDYEVVGVPQEHAGGVFSLDTLQLRWGS